MGQKNGELVERLKAWIERREPQGPYSLQLSPTMACDLNCVFCRRHDQMPAFYRANREVEHCRYVEMVREGLEMGARVVIVKGGGEPLLRRRLVLEIAALVKARGAFGNLVTNGTHLDDRVADGLVASGWDQVTISLDGPDPETHDALRDRSGTFDRIMRNLDRLNAVKARRGSAAPMLGFHLVLTRRNFDRIDRFVELARRMRAGHVELDSMSVRFPENRSIAMDEESGRRFAAQVPALIERLSAYGLSHNLDRFLRPEYVRREGDGAVRNEKAAEAAGGAARLPCFYPFYQAAITPGGSIVPCCYAEETHRSRTNLNETSFRRAWLDGDPEEYRESMRSGRMMPFCKDCTAMYADNNAEIRGWLAEEREAHAR